MSLGPDSIIASRYKLLHKLGEGGFAVVYKAQDLELGRAVAIKFLKTEGQDSEGLERFLREARLIARVNHPNVVSIYAIDVLESENMPYIVMEYLDGESLASRVSRVGPLFDGECMKLCLALCAGLNQLHEDNILHRDLSSNNIFLCKLADDDSFEPKIIDLGLSKVLADNSPIADKKLTATGLLIGNPAFMSPEQARAETLDKRSDIYSLGCVCYTAVYGHAPFEADTPVALLYKHQNEEPSFSALKWKDQQAATRVISTLRIAMQKSASNRFQSCAEFASALRGESALPTQNKSNRVRNLIALLCIIAIGLLSMYVLHYKKKSPDPPQNLSRRITGRSSLSLSLRKPKSFSELLDVADDFVKQKHKKEALELLNSFKGSLQANERQLLNMRKLTLSASMNLRNEEDALAEKLYSDPTIIDNTPVVSSLIDYFVARDPAKCLVLCQSWQRKNPGERDFQIELSKVRGLVSTRKFSEAQELFPTFDSFELSQNLSTETAVADLEQIKLATRIGLDERIDVVKACDDLSESLPRRRLWNKYHTYIEVANLLESAGLLKHAATLWLAAAQTCKKTDSEGSLSCLRRIFENESYRKYPDTVIEAASEALHVVTLPTEALKIRDLVFAMYCKMDRFDEAKATVIQNYEYFEKTHQNKPEWSSDDVSRLMSIVNGFSFVVLTQRASGDCNRICNRMSEYVKGHREAQAVQVAILACLARDAEERCDFAGMVQFAEKAVDGLEFVSQSQLHGMLAQMLVPLESMCSNLPPRIAVNCLEKIQRAYKKAYPARAQPLALLTLLSAAYSGMLSTESVVKLFPDFIDSLNDFDFATSAERPTEITSLIRFFSNKIDSVEFRSAISKIGSKNASPENLAIRSLALSEYYLDNGQSADFEANFAKFRSQLFDLKKKNSYAYKVLRNDAIILALRERGKSGQKFVLQVVSEIPERERLWLYVELSGYFERFKDYVIWASFLRQNEALLIDSTDNAVFTLIRVQGDCYHSGFEQVLSEQVFARALSDYLARKNLTRADAKNDLNLALLFWGMVRAQVSQGRHDIPLQSFKDLSKALSKFKFAHKNELVKFVDCWQTAAKNGTPNDLKEVEDFRRTML